MSIGKTKKSDLDRAVDFLVSHARNPHDSLRQAQDKVRKRLCYAMEKGDVLPEPLMIETNGEFSPSMELVVWARAKYPSNFAQFKAATTGNIKGVFEPMIGRISSYQVPGNLAECQEALREANASLCALGEQLEAALAEIERLRPLEAKYNHIRETNRLNAKKPRAE